MLMRFDYLFDKYNIRPKGVIHIGASEGQEAEMYYKCGVERSIWIEAIPEVYEKLRANVLKYPHTWFFNACVGEEDGREVEFNISSNDGQSSSYLNFKLHSEFHPDVTFVEKRRMKTVRMDSLLRGTFNDGPARTYLDSFDFLNIDLQGCELLALRGMGDLMNNIKYAYIEVNQGELYENCALVDQIDQFLEQYGLVRVETKWTKNLWGDAFYIKKN